MSVPKKYYWIKLKDDFFDNDTIQYIEEQENGIKYVNFYLKLCLKSLRTEGKLIRCIGEYMIPYDITSLAKLTNVESDTVRVAMELFKAIGLISVLETGEIYLNQIQEMIGSETNKAESMRKKRALDKMMSNNVTSVLPERYPEIEIEKEIEKEIEQDIELEQELDFCSSSSSNKEICTRAYEENSDLISNSNIYSEFETSFKREINQIEKDRIDLWFNTYGYELIKEALAIAVIADKIEMKYIQGILNNWKYENIKTINDLNNKNQIKSELLSNSDSKNIYDADILDYDWLEEEKVKCK